MFENLYRVRWRWSAKGVPATLRGLASDDESVRYDALAAPAVPFLFELVLDPATHDREDLIFFLVSLAFGDESVVLPFSPTESPRHWEGKNERAAYDAVAERVTSLAPLLREEPLRIATAYALAHFPKVAAGTAGDVRRAYEASTDETTRATLIIALAMVSLHSQDKDEVLSLLRRVHSNDDSAILRASAAAGLVLLGAADDDVVQTISAALIDGSAREWRDIPWDDGMIDCYLAKVLPLAASGRETTLAATLIDGLARADSNAKFGITRALLAVAGLSFDYRALSDLQLRALQAIDEYGKWDRNGDAIVNFAFGYAKGLPEDRDDFRSFVQAAETSARGEAVEWKPRERPRARAAERRDRLEPVYFVLFTVMILFWLLSPDAPHPWGVVVVSLLCLGLSGAVFVWRHAKG